MMKRGILSALLCLTVIVGAAQVKLRYQIDKGSISERTVTANGEEQIDIDANALTDGIHMLTYTLTDSQGKASASQTRMFVKQQAVEGSFTGYDYWVNGKTDQLVHTELPTPRSTFTLDETFTMPQLPFDAQRCDIYNDEDGISWACNADTLHLSFFTENGARLDTALVYMDVRTAQPCLDEQAEEHLSDNFTGDLLLRRSLRTNSWNTICLPFSLTREEVYDVWGSQTQLAKLEGTKEWGTDEMKLIFTLTTEGIEANVPCLIKTAGTVSDRLWMTNRTVTWQEQPELRVGDISFLGNYRSGVTVPTGDYYVSQEQFYKSKGLSKMDAYRGWFHDHQASSSRRLVFQLVDDEGETTRIDLQPTEETAKSSSYDLRGMHRPSGSQRGMFIYDGKKLMRK